MTRKELKKLDRIVKAQIRERDNYHCQFPGCNKEGKGLHVHHIYSVMNRSTRWYKPNLILLCPGHHTFRADSAHKAPADFMEFIRERLGEDAYEALKFRAHQVVRKLEFETVLRSLTA